MKHQRSEREFYGATTVGAKGQVVIPCDARAALCLKNGDKLLVFGERDSLSFIKFSTFEKRGETRRPRPKNSKTNLT